MRIVIVSPLPPRRCGIAIYVSHFAAALGRRGIHLEFIEMSEELLVRQIGVIRRDVASDYIDEAGRINDDSPDFVVLQHEYGLFGGDQGEYILALLEELHSPVITVFHTSLPQPDSKILQVTAAVAAASKAIVVMCDAAAQVLALDYGVELDNVRVIPHGFPESERLLTLPESSFSGAIGPVVLSLGLIGPNKGIEFGIRAFANVKMTFPSAQYMVVGETHPDEKKDGVDSYRSFIEAVAEETGVVESVQFINRFTDDDEHISWFKRADVVLLPHLDMRQVSSGTLAYALGYGRPVVATPFVYARAMDAAGAGVVITDSDPESMAGAIMRILSSPEESRRLSQQSLMIATLTTWDVVANEFVLFFDEMTVTT